MGDPPNLLIFGASARAAAFSALRAGLQPWCADLFADADLAAHCPVMRLPGKTYPEGFLRLARGELPGPWMYTGGLENHAELVDAMEAARPLWGNGWMPLFLARDPWGVARILGSAGLPHPTVWVRGFRNDRSKRWLAKPVASAGGTGIHRVRKRPARRRPAVYYQEFVEGTPCAAVYVGDAGKARLLGVTRQLVGEPWLHAAPFHYCGSIGPLPIEPALHAALDRLGDVLAAGCHLRGLFGVDFVLRDGVPWPVEVNPRYTASVEVLEHAAGVPALALHRRVFDPGAPSVPAILARNTGTWVGKAILFARAPLRFPEDGPWQATLNGPPPLDEAPAFADIPWPGQDIDARRPVLSFFTRGSSAEDCVRSLQQIAADLDRRLFA